MQTIGDEGHRLLDWIKRDGEAIKSAWKDSGQSLSLTDYTIMIWKKKQKFASILKGED